jgi:transglutaminase-like putative cysteine protease
MSAQLRLTAYAALATIATATALVSVFSSSGWIIPVMGAILIVSGSCALIRSSPLPSAFEPIAAAIAVLCWITLLDARSKAHLGFIPGRLALHHLARTARHGFKQIHRLPTPAPPLHGLVLLTVVGVAAIALVVDLMTVTLRRAALSGLPLLALFTVCAATGHHGVGIFPFIAAAIGYLWLLYADNREKVARWGAAVGTGSRARPASAWSTDGSNAPAPASLGRRVGAAAIGVGVIIPLFIPGLHTGIDKHGTGGGGSGGGGNQVVLNPIVSVANDLTSHKVEPLITYTTNSPDPGYLRLTSLDLFNGSTFSSATLQAPARAAASENLPVAEPPGPVVNTSISISTNLARLHWLPAPATVVGVSVGDSWRYDPGTATIFSATTTGGGLHYTTRSVTNDPTPAELSSVSPPTGDVEADLTVPTNISPAVRRLTRSITSKATNPYEAAIDIQNFFTTGSRFTYDTSIPPDNSPDALADFLLRTRRGFCQQFATAMAVMARLSGIPSRVGVGFTRGEKQANGSWLITTHDAHAWPELYFQGYGWLPFEPTPRGDGQAVPLGYANGATVNTGTKSSPSPSPKPATGPSSSPNRKPNLHQLGGAAGGGSAPGGSNSSFLRSRAGEALLTALVVILVLLLPGAARRITRRRRWQLLSDPARAPDAAWAELRDSAIDLHVPWDDGHTPRQIAAAVLATLRADADTRAAMQRLARCEERSRYAPTPGESEANLRADVMTVRGVALAKRTPTQRAVARFMPRSTLRVIGAALAQIGNVFDWIDRINAAVRRTIWRRPTHGVGLTTTVGNRP